MKRLESTHELLLSSISHTLGPLMDQKNRATGLYYILPPSLEDSQPQTLLHPPTPVAQEIPQRHIMLQQLALFLSLLAVSSCAAAPSILDQRQDGKFNLHAKLENILVVVATSKSNDFSGIFLVNSLCKTL